MDLDGPRLQRFDTEAVVEAAPSVRAAGGQRVAHAPWREVILLGALTAFGSVAMDMYLPALPQVTRSLKTTPDKAQATVSVFLFGLAFGQLLFGPVSDRLGRRRPLQVGIALYVVTSAVCALTPSIGLMSGARLFQAVGACAGSVIARAIVRDRYEDHEVLHVFALLSLVFGVAPIVGPMLGGWVLAVAGWRWIFGVQTLFALVMAGCALAFLPESRSEETRRQAEAERPLASYLALIRQRRLVGFLLTGAFAGAALFAYVTASPEVIITLHHVSPVAYGWIFGANAAGLIGAGQINARLARRIPSLKLLRWALIVTFGWGLVLLFDAWTGFGGLIGLLVPIFFVMASLGFSQPNASAAAMTVDRNRAGSTAALLGASFFGVGSLVGAATGALHDGTARPMAIVVVGGLAIAIAIYELMIVRPDGVD